MRTAILVLSLSCCAAGCGRGPAESSPGAEAGFGDGWGWYALEGPPGGTGVGVGAAWGTRNQQLVYLVLADSTTTAATTTTTADGRTAYEVAVKWPDGRTAELRIETPDGTAGTAAHAGRTYDLAAGSVFVLLPRGDRLELRQLKRDLSGVPPRLPGVLKLIREDREILQLFAEGR